MKIVEVINSLKARGGAEVFVISLCKELAKNENSDVYIVTLYEEIHPINYDEIKQYGIKVLSINKKNSRDFLSVIRFRKLIKKLNPDIINSHLNVPFTYLMAFKNKKTKWKYFHTGHSVASLESNKTGKFAIKELLRKKNIRLIGISDEVSKTIIDVYGVAPSYTIYNGVSAPEFNSEENKIYDLICVASFRHVKNHKLLFEIFNEIYSYQKINLVCLGDGNLLEQSKAIVSELPCKDSIIFEGMVNNVFDYLKKSKILVLTSIFEGNPISILEAMSCGLPIVASRVGGIPDVVIDGVNGFTFELNDIEKAKESILKILSDETLYNKMSQQNIVDSKKYSMVECAKQYLKAYMDECIK